MTVPANVTRFLFEIPSLAEELRVVGFSALISVSEPYRIELELACENAALDLQSLIAKSGLIALFDERLPQYLHGEIVAAQQGETGNKFTLYHLSLRPKLYFLGFRSNLRLFQNQTVPDIIAQVLDEAGIQGDQVEFRLTGRYPQREYCTQYKETDLKFVSRLMQEEGIFYFFEHGLDGHKMVLCDRSTAFQDIPGDSTLRYKERTGMATEEESIYELTAHRRISQGKVTLRDYDFEKSRLRLEKTREQGQFTQLEHYRYPGKFTDPADGQRYAELRYQEQQALCETIEGRSNSPRMLLPGYRFRIKEHPRGALNAEYTLLHLSVLARQPQSLGEGASGEGSAFSVSFVAVPSRTEFRPRRDLEAPIINGTQTAFVTGPQGEEIYTDEHGRIKVQFHWDREGQYDQDSSCWMRVSQSLAGDKWGAIALPRVGQEVTVRFMDGDPDRPIVTGTVYNGANNPPYPLPANKTRTLFKSMSTPGGDGFNELRIEDKQGAEAIYIRGEKDLDLNVQNDSREWIGADRHNTVGNDEFESIGSDLNTTIKGNHLHTVGQSLAQTVGKDAQIKINGSHIEEAGQTISIKAGTKLVIEAGFELTLKGGMGLVKLDMTGVTITGPLVRANTGGDAIPGMPANASAPAAPQPADKGDKPGNVNQPGLPNGPQVVEADAEPHVVSAAEDVEEPVVSQAVSARDNTVGVPQSQKQAMGVLDNPVSAPAIKGFIPGDNAFSGAALYDPGNPTLDGALKPGTSVRAVEGLSGFIDGDKYYDVYASGDVVDGILQVDHYVVRSIDNDRNEWVVGPDHLDKFTQNTTSHAVIAGNHFGISGIPDEYAAGANLAITKLNRGDASGAFAALGDGVINSWSNPDNVMAGVAGLAGAGVVAKGVRGVPNAAQRAQRLTLNADRPTSITSRNPVDIAAQRRLNEIDVDRNAYAPGEAGAAAEMEHYLGGALERAPGGSSADFVVNSGDFAGAKIDLKLTPDTFDQASKINQYFDKTFPKFSQSFANKLAKPDGADLMPFDTRFLTEKNKSRLFEFVETLPASSQQKVIYLVQ
nr:type VI secretion system tip protein TssI/VgrG [Ketobacter sp. MCCC 1A13808]